MLGKAEGYSAGQVGDWTDAIVSECLNYLKGGKRREREREGEERERRKKNGVEIGEGGEKERERKREKQRDTLLAKWGTGQMLLFLSV